MWDKPVYEIVCQRLCGTSQFMKQFVRMCPGQTILWNRVAVSAYTAAILMGRVSVFRLRIEQGNNLPFDNTNPEDGQNGVAEFH